MESLGWLCAMAVPGLKDFNQLIDSARAEIEAWSKTPAAAAVPASSLDYAREVLRAIEDSVSIGSLAVGFRNVLSTVESFGVVNSSPSVPSQCSLRLVAGSEPP